MLGRMESDDAADLLMELDQDRRLPVLERLPAARQVKVKRLLGYNPQTAGGLMNPDFVSAQEHSTVEQALELVRLSDTPPERTQHVVVVDEEGGSPARCRWRRSSKPPCTNPSATCPSRTAHRWPPETDVPEVARVMTDYNLTALPVVDGDGKPIGVLTVDDVLELMLPEDWRRRFGWRGIKQRRRW